MGFSVMRGRGFTRQGRFKFNSRLFFPLCGFAGFLMLNFFLGTSFSSILASIFISGFTSAIASLFQVCLIFPFSLLFLFLSLLAPE